MSKLVLDVTVAFPWWVRPYTWALAAWCALRGAEPDTVAYEALLTRVLRVECKVADPSRIRA